MGIPVCFIGDFLYCDISKVQIEKVNRLGIILQITSQTWLPLKRYVYRSVVASRSHIYPFPNCLNLPLRSSMTSRSSRSWWWRCRSVLPIYLTVPTTWNITCTDCLSSPMTSRTYQGCLSLCFLPLDDTWFGCWGWEDDLEGLWVGGEGSMMSEVDGDDAGFTPESSSSLSFSGPSFFLSEESLQKMKIAIIFWLLYSTFSLSQDWSDNKMTVWTRRSVCHVQRQNFLTHRFSISTMLLYIT